jgi:hypothetical protein
LPQRTPREPMDVELCELINLDHVRHERIGPSKVRREISDVKCLSQNRTAARNVRGESIQGRGFRICCKSRARCRPVWSKIY